MPDSLWAQNDTGGDPTGIDGGAGGLVTTGGSFDGFNGNVQRAVTDLVVPGSVGTIPLAFTRYYNSRFNATSTAFADAGWRHSYQWSGTVGTNANGATVYTINYPSGQTVNFRLGRTTAPVGETFARGQVGTNDRLEITPSRDTGHNFLHLSDGTQVVFPASLGKASALIDLNGAVTTLTYGTYMTAATPQEPAYATPVLVKVTEPGGRSLNFSYGTQYYSAQNGAVYSQWTVLSSVTYQGATSSDYLAASYNYTVYPYDSANQGGNNTVYAALTTVGYSQASTAGGPVYAKYTYAAANAGVGGTGIQDASSSGAPPLLISADDPYFAGPMSRIGYTYVAANGNLGIWGVVLSENNFATGEVVSRLDQDHPGAPTRSVNTRGDHADTNNTAIARTMYYGQTSTSAGTANAQPFQPTTVTDFQGSAIYLTYNAAGSANGQGYVASFTDASNVTTAYATEPLVGKVKKVTLADGRNRKTTWAGIDPTTNEQSLTATNPYFVTSTTDERGNVTAYDRYGNTGFVYEIDYPDNSHEYYQYKGFSVNGQAFYKESLFQNKLGAQISYGYDETDVNHGGSGHQGLLTSVTRSYALAGSTVTSEKTSLYYDGLDRVNKTVDPRGVTTTYLYDNRHHLIQTTHTADNTTVAAKYDDYGNPYSVTDENTLTTTTSFDEYHRVIEVSVPVNGTQANGSQVASRYQAFAYDRRNTSHAVIGDALSHTGSNWSVSFKPTGPGVERIFSPNNWQTDEYDGMYVNGSTNPVTPQPGAGYVHASATYFANGQVRTRTDAQGFVTTYGYDTTERLSTVSDAMNHVTSRSYYGLGVACSNGNNCTGLLQTLTTPGTDATYNATIQTQYTNYDIMGRPLATEDPKSNTFNTLYDAEGNVISQSDGINPTRYGTDQLGRKTVVTYPDNSTERWGYDTSGNVSTYTNRNAEICTYQYDGRNRCSRYDWGSGGAQAVGYSYDAGGRVTEVLNATADVLFAYDDSGALKREKSAVAGQSALITSYTHDYDGNVDSITYPTGNLPCFSYDNQDRPTRMYAGSTTFVQYNYAENWLAGRGLGNGLYTAYAYQNNGRVSYHWHYRGNLSGTQSNNGSVSLQFYGYAPDGQVSWTQRQGGGDQSGNNSALDTEHGDVFNYWPDGSLQYGGHQVSVTNNAWPGQQSATADARVADNIVSYATPTASSTYPFQYNYDAAGNRTQAIQMGQPTIPYSDNTQHPNENRYQGSSYDTNGNTTNSAVGWTYNYDAENKLINASNPSTGQILQCGYDGLGRLVTQVTGTAAAPVTTLIYYAGKQRIEECNTSNQAEYLYFYDAAGSDTPLFRQGPQGLLWFLSDALGNTTHLCDNSGNVLEQYLYDSYGTPSVYNASGTQLSGTQYDNRQLFKSNGGYQWLPGPALYYARARFYLPQHGRWLQPDPVGQAGGLNIYTYCGNDPLNLMDPSGLWTFWGVLQSIGQGFNTFFNAIATPVENWFSGGPTQGRVTVTGKDPNNSQPHAAPSDNADDVSESKRLNEATGNTGVGLFIFIPDMEKMSVVEQRAKEGMQTSGNAALNMATLPLGGAEATGEAVVVTAKAVEEEVVEQAVTGAAEEASTLTRPDLIAGAKSALARAGATPGVPLTPSQLAGLQSNLEAYLVNAAKALNNPTIPNAASQFYKGVERVELILDTVDSGVGAESTLGN